MCGWLSQPDFFRKAYNHSLQKSGARKGCHVHQHDMTSSCGAKRTEGVAVRLRVVGFAPSLLLLILHVYAATVARSM